MISKLAIVWLLSSALVVLAEVDSSKPDLSAFKLRKVDYKELARRRASRPITDLANGAVQMHQSLFVRDPVVRCAAYAHLFKLISGQTEEKQVRQDAVEAIAIMATAQKDLYHSLLLGGATTDSASHFLTVGNLLEWQRDQESRETWLDLVRCMHEFMSSSPEVAEWLEEPNRSLSVRELENFKSVPVEPSDGVVGYVTGKLEGVGPDAKPGHHIGGRYVSDDLFNKSRDLVLSLDSEQLKAAREEFSARPAAPETPVEVEQVEVPAAEPKDVQKDVDPKEVELIVTEEGSVDPNYHFDEVQLAILQFVKLRLQETGKESRLSIQLALDFESHWEDLQHTKLDPTTNVGKAAIHFLQEPNSAQVAARVDAAIHQYSKIVNLIAEIRMQEDRLKSVDQLAEPVERLGRLLSAMDGAFDVDDVRRVYSIFTAKLQEYRTVDKFINMRR